MNDDTQPREWYLQWVVGDQGAFLGSRGFKGWWVECLMTALGRRQTFTPSNTEVPKRPKVLLSRSGHEGNRAQWHVRLARVLAKFSRFCRSGLGLGGEGKG